MSQATESGIAAFQELSRKLENLQRRVAELERMRETPAFIPLTDFAEWYRRRMGAAIPPISEAQLRRWVQHRHRLQVDWIRQEKPQAQIYVAVGKLLAWLDRMERHGLVRVNA